MKQDRLLKDLSRGIISDDEYHMQMYNRPRPDYAPELSGTGFYEAMGSAIDASSISPNSDPLGRSITPEGSKECKV